MKVLDSEPFIPHYFTVSCIDVLISVLIIAYVDRESYSALIYSFQRTEGADLRSARRVPLVRSLTLFLIYHVD